MAVNRSLYSTTPMTPRFSELTNQQLLDYNSDELMDTVRVEAIEQGIKPPVPISEAIQLSGFRGHFSTKDSLAVYKLGSDGYSDDIGWLTEEEAHRAMQGAVLLESTYSKGVSGKRISANGAVVIKRVVLPGEPEQYKIAKLTEYVNEDTAKYEALLEECTSRIESVRQEAYNQLIAKERQAEYLRLAGGDIEIAKRFWVKAESLAWPEAEA
jgi:hypothetical protein